MNNRLKKALLIASIPPVAIHSVGERVQQKLQRMRGLNVEKKTIPKIFKEDMYLLKKILKEKK